MVTPVCPHSLTHRPLVVTETSQIELRVETGEEQAFLSIDGQVGLPVQQGDRVLCQRADAQGEAHARPANVLRGAAQ